MNMPMHIMAKPTQVAAVTGLSEPGLDCGLVKKRHRLQRIGLAAQMRTERGVGPEIAARSVGRTARPSTSRDGQIPRRPGPGSRTTLSIALRLLRADLGADALRRDVVVLSRDQSASQQPGRLHCHADAFSDNWMGFAGDVPGKKYAMRVTLIEIPADPNAKPSAIQHRALQGIAYAEAESLNVLSDHFSRLRTSLPFAGTSQFVAPDAAG